MLVDIERWPERIPTVDAVERLATDRGHRLPDTVAAATAANGGVDGHRADRRVLVHLELELAGVTVTAAHHVEPDPDGSRLTLALRFRARCPGSAG